MSNFVVISRKEFEDFLNKFSVVDEPSSKEIIYEIHTDNSKVNIRIYSSIDISGGSRELGEDAIRCVLIDNKSNKPIDKAKRTHRMSNWKERLQEKIDDLKKETKELKSCQTCGSVMVLRDGPRGRFYGCLSYPQCKTSMDLFGVSRVKSEPQQCEVEGVVRCPDCDAAMTKRSGRRGDFYGCTNFFKTGCKGTRKVEEVEIYGKGVDEEQQLLDFEVKPEKSVEIETPVVVKESKEIELISSSQYPHLKFKFEQFNPVQSEVFQYYDKDVNCVVAAATSAGKTTVAEMFMAHSISQGKKAIFLSPLKAVSQEKYEDWTEPSHDWSKLNISIVTGDYALTDARVEELNKANIVIMTTEMLDSRTRRIAIEKNNWLLETGVVVQDEAHLLCVKGRGDKTESAIMRFTKQNPSCRIVFLSATMPNVDELARWLSSLNNKKTELINSQYRPIQLDIHYEPYDDYGKYQTVEVNKIQKTIELTQQIVKRDEQVLIFVHAKKTGNMIVEMLKHVGIDATFHFADLTRVQREEISRKTKTKQIKVLVATSGLAWGINI
jgi:superfamily II RNA helicase